MDGQGILHAMFPSRTKEGLGTINLASRPWNQPMRKSSFHISGHRGPSLTLACRSYRVFRLEVALLIRGTARMIWDHQPLIGPDRPKSDSGLHRLTLTRHDGLERNHEGWSIVSFDEEGVETVRSRALPRRSLSSAMNTATSWSLRRVRNSGKGCCRHTPARFVCSPAPTLM